MVLCGDLCIFAVEKLLVEQKLYGYEKDIITHSIVLDGILRHDAGAEDHDYECHFIL